MRKDQATLTSAEKTAFVNAVLAVKQKASLVHPNDRSFSRYDDFVEVHLNAGAGVWPLASRSPSPV
jgi:hypothetical protein